MLLSRVVHFDESDTRVFSRPARTGEWAIAGGFEFSNWSEGDLMGKQKQAFANGWLGLETFGRATFVAVAKASDGEIEALTDNLARHFVQIYGAPDLATARPVAEAEIAQMTDLCADFDANTVLAISRELTQAGVRETYRAIPSDAAALEQFAIHGTLDEDDAQPMGAPPKLT